MFTKRFEGEELRLYSFVIGLYLSPIQHGIQTGHAAVQIVREHQINYNHDPRPVQLNLHEEVIRWADDHKTFIILSASNHAGLVEVADTLRALSGPDTLPFTCFHEDEASLKGLMTCVATVLPESIFKVRRVRWDDRPDTFTYENSTTGKLTHYGEDHPWYPVINLIKSCPFA